MSALEIIALIFIAILVVKLVVLAINPKAWYRGPLAKLFSNTNTTYAISFTFGVVLLVYLLRELSIVEIFAVVVFASFLMALTMAPYMKQLIGMVQRDIEGNKNFLYANWLSTTVWLTLIVWVVWEILT